MFSRETFLGAYLCYTRLCHIQHFHSSIWLLLRQNIVLILLEIRIKIQTHIFFFLFCLSYSIKYDLQTVSQLKYAKNLKMSPEVFQSYSLNKNSSHMEKQSPPGQIQASQGSFIQIFRLTSNNCMHF